MPSPTKRASADDVDASDARSKRRRHSRWESSDDTEPDADHTAAQTALPATKQSALSDVVKRLASVVKQKSELLPSASLPVPTNAPSQAAAAAAARARALAQASLLSMGLQTTQVSSSDLAKRVYVGNLYYDLKDEDVRNVFGPFGTIRSIDLTMEPGTQRSKGFCFIEYEDVLAAESAVQVLNGVHLANRSLKVGRPIRGNSADPTAAQNIGKEAIKNVPTKCVYVGSVRVELTSHHLQSIFSPFGDIRSCVMPPLSPLESTPHRGYGFLEFADEQSANNAIQHMNGFELAGQKLKVGKASPSAMLINLAVSQDKLVHAHHQPASNSTSSPTTASVQPHIPPEDRRCVCLLNLVSKGEVDDELEEEVRDECSRFGAVEKVQVQELETEVRVFVLFETTSGAAAAKSAMNGRFFGGNQVHAGYYPIAELTSGRYDSGVVRDIV